MGQSMRSKYGSKEFILFSVYLSIFLGGGVGGCGRLFEAGHFLAFPPCRMGAYSKRPQFEVGRLIE